jgi:hypothetical protein
VVCWEFRWVMRVNARQMYEAETSPHHRADYEGGVQEARGESAMAFTMLESAQGVVETFAGAPDWLFGRGCLKEVCPHPPPPTEVTVSQF